MSVLSVCLSVCPVCLSVLSLSVCTVMSVCTVCLSVCAVNVYCESVDDDDDDVFVVCVFVSVWCAVCGSRGVCPSVRLSVLSVLSVSLSCLHCLYCLFGLPASLIAIWVVSG